MSAQINILNLASLSAIPLRLEVPSSLSMSPADPTPVSNRRCDELFHHAYLMQVPAVRYAEVGGTICRISSDDDEMTSTPRATGISAELRAQCLELYRAGDEDSQMMKKLIEGLSVASLFQALHDPDPEVHYGSAHGLAAMGKPTVKPLIEALRDPKAQIRKCAAFALGRNVVGEKDPKAIEARLPVLQDPSGEVREAAASSLIGSEDMRVAKEYIRLLRDPESRVRAAAVRGLGDMAESHLHEKIRQKALDPVLLALKDPDKEVRLSAVCALRSFRHVEGLLMARADPDHEGLRTFLAMYTLQVGTCAIMPLTDAMLLWEKVGAKGKALKLLAKTVYQKMKTEGHKPEEFVILGSEILALIAQEMNDEKSDDQDLPPRVKTILEAVGREDWKQAFRQAKLLTSPEEYKSLLQVLPSDAFRPHRELNILKQMLAEAICKTIDGLGGDELALDAKVLILEENPKLNELRGLRSSVAESIKANASEEPEIQEALTHVARYLQGPLQVMRLMEWVGVPESIAYLLSSERPVILHMMTRIFRNQPAVLELYLNEHDGAFDFNERHMREVFRRLLIGEEEASKAIENRLRNARSLVAITERVREMSFILDYLNVVKSCAVWRIRRPLSPTLRSELLSTKEAIMHLKETYAIEGELRSKTDEARKTDRRSPEQKPETYDEALKVVAGLLERKGKANL